MQTFLPLPDFAESARCLDPARLGKQRVEALQILRALALPVYGWKNHPAVQMWGGNIASLTRYSLEMVDAWTERGNADSTRASIAEFAPEAASAPLSTLRHPSWLGDERFHLSHQSNLLRKWPEFYGAQFPGVPDDLPYVWPAADQPLGIPGFSGPPVWVFRPRTETELNEWLETETVSLAEASPLGRRSRGWLAQLDVFAELQGGAPIAVLADGGARLLSGRLSGEVNGYLAEIGEAGIRRAVRFEGELLRSQFPYPALLQDPRTIFETVGPAQLDE